MDRSKPTNTNEPVEPDPNDVDLDRDRRSADDVARDANPPRTTKGGVTAPKFGSAGSGGLELEPGPEKD
ncbi:MAG TPA: hypothetical protein VHB25_14305 [Gemmatimonadaceae bacterium]|nr:hypothetical protein [Gemmatimonadaceae bacterium]